MNNQTIGSIAELIGGQIMTRISFNAQKDDESAIVERRKILIPKAISNGKVNHKELPEEALMVKADSKKLTKTGDIVIKLSTPYDAALITEDDEGLLIPSFCAILTNIKEVDTKYLLAFLNSVCFKDEIKKSVAGLVMTIVSVGKIREIVIPQATIEEQKRIGNEYWKVLERMELLNRICELEEKKLELTFRELAKRL